MSARSVVEATAKAKGITDGTLHKKIEEMYRQNIISEHVKEQVHEVRYLGNDMAHGDFVEPIIAEDADEVLALMAAVLDAVFQSHARLKRVRDARIAQEERAGLTTDVVRVVGVDRCRCRWDARRRRADCRRKPAREAPTPAMATRTSG